MKTVTISVARQTLPAQIDRVIAGGQVAITRRGEIVAVLVSPDQVKTPAPKAGAPTRKP